MQRYEAGFCTKAKERKQKGERRPLRCQMRRTHCIEGQRPTSALQNSEAQKNCERSDMRDKQIQETSAADLGDAMLCRDKEIGGERHHFPREHECIGIVRLQETRGTAGTKGRAPCPAQHGSSPRRKLIFQPTPHRGAAGRQPTAHRGANETASPAARSAAPRVPPPCRAPKNPRRRCPHRRAPLREKAYARQIARSSDAQDLQFL